MSDDRPWAFLTGLADPNTDDTGERPTVTVLHRGDTETVIRLAFLSGQTMPDHTAAHPIVVLGQDGTITFTVDDTAHRLVRGTAIRVDARVPHSLRADTDATATLIVVHGS
ncbi:MAG: cupin domain-containing protein [Gordonia sp. (in: high G+C Gram-positive bacteria)]|uniref:cupin domain-containing protein n=1 Tax=Gordonia sp. (in: high G+C Gram-positive bacteria) TaxID=84139 RepID=UPI0039E4A551